MKTLGVLGCGNMGHALACGAAGSKNGLRTLCYDIDPVRAADLARKTGGKAAASPGEVLDGSDAVLIAVKPNGIAAALEGTNTADRLLISIAAGIRLSRLQEIAPDARWIRVMPNTPVLVGEGVLGWSAGPEVSQEDGDFFAVLFSGTGSLYPFPEPLLDTVTGLSGSGPAYVFTIINALAEGAVLDGMPKAEALEIAARTVYGAAKMVLEEGSHPEILKDRVTSPGGTTAAGLAVLEERGIRSALISAVKRAAERSRELGG